MDTEKQTVNILIKSQALLEGHFLLSSGLHSGKYVQCAKALSDTKAASTLGKLLAEKCKILSFDFVISPALGGVIIGHEVARHLGLPFIFTERHDSIMTLRRGFTIESNKRYLIVEDVVTTGKSSLEVGEVIISGKGIIAGYASIVDRRINDKFEVDLIALTKQQIESFDPASCPLCHKGLPIVKPGSR
jgi:orotate phosphoribosyltransferase